MEDVITMIANVGFPMAVAVYLLTRLDKRMEELQCSITMLCDQLKNQKSS